MQTYFRERNSTSMLGIGVQSKADCLFSATFCQPFKWNLSHAALIELFFSGNPLEGTVGCCIPTKSLRCGSLKCKWQFIRGECESLVCFQEICKRENHFLANKLVGEIFNFCWWTDWEKICGWVVWSQLEFCQYWERELNNLWPDGNFGEK